VVAQGALQTLVVAVRAVIGQTTHLLVLFQPQNNPAVEVLLNLL
jgi:hypothetical protein